MAFLGVFVFAGVGGESVGLETNVNDFYILPSISITNLVLTAIITFSLSILVNLMFSRKIKKLDLVESLKGNE